MSAKGNEIPYGTANLRNIFENTFICELFFSGLYYFFSMRGVLT